MNYLWTALLSLLPISELRGGIPYAMLHDIPWYVAWPFASAINALVAPLCWLFLVTVNRLFYDVWAFSWYRSLFDRFVERARQQLHGGIEKWGMLGVAIFVAIPLPMTGAWTGTIGAWVLGLSKRKTLLAVILGVITAGAVVTVVMLLGSTALKMIFAKGAQ